LLLLLLLLLCFMILSYNQCLTCVNKLSSDFSELEIHIMRSSLSLGLLFAVLIIQGYLLVFKNFLAAAFTSIIRGFWNKLS
jgi:hypothetical protein